MSSSEPGPIKRWLNDRQPPNWTQFAIQVSAGLVLLAVVFLGGRASTLDLTERIPLWVLLLSCGLLFAAGFTGGVLVMRLVAKRRLADAEEKHRLALTIERQDREAVVRELELAKEQLKSIDPATQSFQRLSVYVDVFYNLHSDILAGEVSLAGFPESIPLTAKTALCSLTRQTLAREAGIDVQASLWAEQRRLIRQDKYRVLAAPHHTKDEDECFANITIRGSWMSSAYEQRHNRRDRLCRCNDLAAAGLYGPDTDVFRELGYLSVRVIEFEVGDDVGRLLFLASQAEAFTPLEDRYFELLKVALKLAGSQAAASQ